MIKMGFDPGWVQLIMACVRSVKYSIRFKSNTIEQFIPTRGICQRDPLSPYLFLIVEEGLSCMLNNVEAVGDIVGVRICRDAPVVSHLLFVDDSLILMKADRRTVLTLQNILDTYCDAKSSIYFSLNTYVDEKVEVCQALDILTQSLNDRYLGLSAVVEWISLTSSNILRKGLLQKYLVARIKCYC